ncbi:hypothetical protein [Flavobacterium noncentrifugens]|uniref:Uncharacterized protein n=1 Tax=Flavobacterium noncentrifugens TaxID=1128970 RepID=A0A1G8VXS3_9FLAO|nr:hypothetical protein [Flavobacterium noncentrifugens]SDJ70888.1 hypothetical protein SAMN04487935_1560 [Flavobacterium noncentrifugens]
MAFFKKILVFSAIVAALFFISYEKQILVIEVTSEKPQSFYGDEGLHSLAFIQPQAEHHVVSENKTGNVFYAKWFSNHIGFKPIFKVLNPFKTFFLQDANRCESVSLLIFPFHFFW